VLVDLEQPVKRAAQRGLETLPFLAHGRLADLLGDLAQRVRHLEQSPVLALEGVDGVAGGDVERLMLLEGVGEHLDVHVAEALDLVLGDAALDELLLHGGDLGRLDVGDELLETRPDLVHRPAGVEVPDDGVERLEARRVDRLGVRHVRDLRPRAGLLLDLGGDVVHKLVERHVPLFRHRVEGRHATDGATQDRVRELLELGVVVGEEVEQEGMLLEQRVHRGLRCDRHTLLRRSGSNADGMLCGRSPAPP